MREWPRAHVNWPGFHNIHIHIYTYTHILIYTYTHIHIHVHIHCTYMYIYILYIDITNYECFPCTVSNKKIILTHNARYAKFGSSHGEKISRTGQQDLHPSGLRSRFHTASAPWVQMDPEIGPLIPLIPLIPTAQNMMFSISSMYL